MITAESNRSPQRFLGICAARGMTTGPCFLIRETALTYSRQVCSDAAADIARFEKALDKSEQELLDLQSRLDEEGAKDEARIFQAHTLFLRDESLREKTVEAVRGGLNVEAAWMDAIEYFANQIASLSDPVFAARSADVRDVGQRVLARLLGIDTSLDLFLREPSVVVARDLAPSQTAGLDRSLVRGFCTAEGGPSSHTAILAKALGVPAIVGLGKDILEIESGIILLVDASRGELIANPSGDLLAEFRTRMNQHVHIAENEMVEAQALAFTKDKSRVEVVANVGSREDAIAAIRQGAEGIGLLRTEFLYLNRREAPSEEEQLAKYAAIFDIMGQRPIVVRTLDVGGDKDIPYLRLEREANPFLGLRAIRLCLDQPDFFKSQLRAILRASQGHDVRIMFPMIATIDELRAAKRIYAEATREVTSVGYPITGRIQLGIMVEIPSTVIMADQFAREVDFFSIGTNDLTQYTMAADRGNTHVAHLADACHPAVLRQIRQVIVEGHRAGIWVGLCGGLGGDPTGIPILLGMGLDEFSMAPSEIPHAKAILREWTKSEAGKVAAAVLNLDSAEKVRAYVVSASGDTNRKISH